MSNTPIQVTTELSKALEQINQKLDKIDAKFETKLDKIDTKFETKLDKIDVKFETRLDKIDERLNKLEIGQTRIEEKMDGLSKRVDSVDFINCGVFVALIIAILGGFAKIFGFIGNP
jgi:predicted nuclease with TOPRIM domain